jgi:hypothetical protein
VWRSRHDGGGGGGGRTSLSDDTGGRAGCDQDEDEDEMDFRFFGVRSAATAAQDSAGRAD